MDSTARGGSAVVRECCTACGARCRRCVHACMHACMHACRQLYISHIIIIILLLLLLLLLLIIIVRFRLTFISSSSDGVNGRRSSELDMCTTPNSSRACVALHCDPTVVRFSSKPKHSKACERLRSAEAFRGGRRTQHRAQQPKLAHCATNSAPRLATCTVGVHRRTCSVHGYCRCESESVHGALSTDRRGHRMGSMHQGRVPAK
jgi:hypothetical protein